MPNIKKAAQAVVDVNKPIPTLVHSIQRKDLLSTGSTLLNLAFSDNPWGGLLKGKYYYIVGDSASGKTFLSMTCFAEAQLNKHFKDYRLIYDNIEDGCLMDVEGLFGEAVADKIEFPANNEDGDPVFSFTVEEFYYHLDDALKDGRPFIYVLDSMDGLSSEFEGDKFEQHKDAHRTGKQSPGSYGDGKAKKNSEGLRQVLDGLRDSGSILIILSQTRDNLGMGWEKRTRSGGHALRFYATVEVWSSITGKIRKTVKGRQREIGVKVELNIKKNRITGKTREVEVDIYPSYGIDDIGSCVDWLIMEKIWSKKGQKIDAFHLGLLGTREKIIKAIEEEGMEDELKNVVDEAWKEIEAASMPSRKNKY